MEIDRATTGFKEPTPVEVLEVDEFLAQRSQAEGGVPLAEGIDLQSEPDVEAGSDEGSAHHGAEIEEQETPPKMLMGPRTPVPPKADPRRMGASSMRMVFGQCLAEGWCGSPKGPWRAPRPIYLSC